MEDTRLVRCIIYIVVYNFFSARPIIISFLLILSLCSRYFLSLSCVCLFLGIQLHSPTAAVVYIFSVHCVFVLYIFSFFFFSFFCLWPLCLTERKTKKKTRGGKWWGEEGTIWATILNSSIGSGRLFDFFFFFFSLLYIFRFFSLLFSSATRVRRKNTLCVCVHKRRFANEKKMEGVHT